MFLRQSACIRLATGTIAQIQALADASQPSIVTAGRGTGARLPNKETSPWTGSSEKSIETAAASLACSAVPFPANNSGVSEGLGDVTGQTFEVDFRQVRPVKVK